MGRHERGIHALCLDADGAGVAEVRFQKARNARWALKPSEYLGYNA
jgi:hypothetical protein